MDTVVMIPGLGSDAAVWQPTINELTPDIKCQIGDTLSDDSLRAMATRILKHAPLQFALAGVSMGGMVALEVVRAAPERVTRLMLCDTNARPDTDEKTARRLATNAAMLAAPDLATLAKSAIVYMIHPHADPEVGEALIKMTRRVGARAYVRQNEATMARDDLRPVLGSISVPTMVVVGADDLMTPVNMAREISDGVAGASLHVIPNCGHLPPIENPSAVAALMHDWLRIT